jgi:hypothetical protein
VTVTSAVKVAPEYQASMSAQVTCTEAAAPSATASIRQVTLPVCAAAGTTGAPARAMDATASSTVRRSRDRVGRMEGPQSSGAGRFDAAAGISCTNGEVLATPVGRRRPACRGVQDRANGQETAPWTSNPSVTPRTDRGPAPPEGLDMTRLLAIFAALLVLAPTGAVAQGLDASGTQLLSTFQYEGVTGTGTAPYFNAGTDLAFDGDVVVAPQQGDDGKIHLFRADADQPGQVDLLTAIPCYGDGQNDVAVIRPGLLAVAYHQGTCGAGDVVDSSNGVSFHDISSLHDDDPTNDEAVLLQTVSGLPGGTHTLTPHPSEPVVYASPGGIANGGGVQQIIDISDLSAPQVHTFKPNEAGCHDFSVVERDDITLGICVGLTESQIWDLTDPLAPVILSHIVNPLIQFDHTGVTTSDGTLLVIGDETLAAQECVGGPTGAMFAYDISDPALPIPQGFFAIDRNAGDNPISAQDRTNWCTAHIFSFVGDSRTMVASWYTGGMNVIDWSDPLSPREVAHHQMDAGTDRLTTSNYWSAYFHDGLVYANDRGRGALDVIAVEGLTAEGMADAPSTREGAWTAGSILDAPAAMLAHARVRAALAPRQDALVCALRPGAGAAPIAPRPALAGLLP